MVREKIQDVTNGVDAGPHFVVGFDDVPGSEVGVGVIKHRRLGGGVIVPSVVRREIDRAELPLLQGIALPSFEPALLLNSADGEVELDDADAGVRPHLLDPRCIDEELVIFLLGAESHYFFDAGAVVPGAVEKSDLAIGRQVLDVPLEVPLSGFLARGFFECDYFGSSGVEVLHKATDRSTFSSRVTAFVDDQDLLAGVAHPVLHLDKLNLERELVFVVTVEADFSLVGISAFAEEFTTLFGVEVISIFRSAVISQLSARHRVFESITPFGVEEAVCAFARRALVCGFVLCHDARPHGAS